MKSVLRADDRAADAFAVVALPDALGELGPAAREVVLAALRAQLAAVRLVLLRRTCPDAEHRQHRRAHAAGDACHHLAARQRARRVLCQSVKPIVHCPLPLQCVSRLAGGCVAASPSEICPAAFESSARIGAPPLATSAAVRPRSSIRYAIGVL